ncbi:MAG: hypothetical protein AB1608_01590 [Thermoproteota archaeon]
MELTKEERLGKRVEIIPKLRDIIPFVIISVSIFGITWIYNYFAQFVEYKLLLLPILKHAEPIVVGLLIAGWFLRKSKSNREIMAVSIVTGLCIFLNVDQSLMRNLWDNRVYPSLPITFQHHYIPPIDPFQQIALFSIFLMRTSCEKGIAFLIKTISRKITSSIK